MRRGSRFRYCSAEVELLEPVLPVEPVDPLEPPMFGQSWLPRAPFAGADGVAGAVEVPLELGVVVLDVAAPAVPIADAPIAPPAKLRPTTAPAIASFRMGFIKGMLLWGRTPDALCGPGRADLAPMQHPDRA